jgi:hypothetical protein
MRVRTISRNRGGRPREFNESDALKRMQRQLWTTGLSGTFLDGIARSAGLNRPSPPRATKPGHRPYPSGPRGRAEITSAVFHRASGSAGSAVVAARNDLKRRR